MIGERIKPTKSSRKQNARIIKIEEAATFSNDIIKQMQISKY